MKIQVLVATINQKDYSLIDKMNIQTNVIVGNQCNKNEVKEFECNDKIVKWYSFSEKGVGLNRNNTLMRANADICILADDDMVYVNGYENIVKNAFINNPKADVIIFNLIEKEPKRYINNKVRRVNRFNYLRYGAARIAFKLDKVRLNGIYFNQCFGGGTEYCHGEDNIFLSDCLKKKLKVYTSPEFIATLIEQRESTWSREYNDKYFHDQGILYKVMYPRLWKILCMQDAIRHSKLYKQSWIKVYKKMIKNRRK